MPKVSEVISKISEHTVAVTSVLSKPLHESTYKEIIETSARVLKEHPDFELGAGSFKLKNGLYQAHEIAYRIIGERIASQLNAEGLLSQRHKNLFIRLYGRLHYNPPDSIYKERRVALEKLAQKLGNANEVLRRAAELFEENSQAINEHSANAAHEASSVMLLFSHSQARHPLKNLHRTISRGAQETPLEIYRRELV